MEMIKYGDIDAVYQLQGNTKNGNPLYIVNFFHDGKNINSSAGMKMDKHGNIKVEIEPPYPRCYARNILDYVYDISCDISDKMN